MSFTISVCLLSGHLADLEVSPAQSVLELMIQASKTLGRPLKSLAYQGRRLLRGESVKELGLEDGSVVNALVRQPGSVLCGHRKCGAFACLKIDGAVATWGHPDCLDNHPQQENLNAQQLYASSSAFAAITDQGEVVAWGDPAGGGDCQDVADQLRFVQNVYASQGAFAAVRTDGTVVCWGSSRCGGDASSVQAMLTNIQVIVSTHRAFAALRSDGTVVTWGHSQCGGDSNAVQNHLTHVQEVYATETAFAALRTTGEVVTWGDEHCGGDARAVQEKLHNVSEIFASNKAFAALKKDGTVVTWGKALSGGDSSAVQAHLFDVERIYCGQAMAALRRDGSVITWGHSTFGGDSRSVQGQLEDIQQIYSTDAAFAALKRDATVVAWGHPEYGGDCSKIKETQKDAEFAIHQARRLAEEWGLCEGGKAVATFADLGSGVGKLVVQSYLEWPGVHRALGVELSATRAKRALEAWEALLLSDEAFELRQMALNLAGDNDATPNPAEEVKLLHGDLLDADLSDVTHAYVSSLCFPESLIFDVSLKLKQAPRLRAVASLQPLNLDSGARLLALPTSWTSRRGMGTIAHFYDLG